MSERSGTNPEHAKAVIKDWGQAIFGDQPFRYSGQSGNLVSASRAKYNIPVGELNYEDYGVPYQPVLSIVESLDYPWAPDLPLLRRLTRRILIPHEQKRLLVQAKAMEPESRYIHATYRALAVTTGQVSGYYTGLEISASARWTSSRDSPEVYYRLLDDDIPSRTTERLEKYKQELTGISGPNNDQIMDALAALAVSSENITE